MTNLLGPASLVGYCTNVHAGVTLRAMRDNLDRHATAVRGALDPVAQLPIGLWLAREAATDLLRSGETEALRRWLRQRGLQAYTFNGFPYGDFHATQVKHGVYAPDWTTEERTRYTIDLAEILVGLLDRGSREGSISTLPVGWRSELLARPDAVELAARNLGRVARSLADLEARSGVCVHVDLEPEPGCLLDTADDVVAFFETQLSRQGEPQLLRRHLRVCHDVCHASVMFREQAAELARYRDSGIRVGKLQLSSAVRAPLERLEVAERREALEQLARFEERRYLHQTVVRQATQHRFFDDLPAALAAAEVDGEMAGEWRVHFHLPLFVDQFGRLESTHEDVLRAIAALRPEDGVTHFEVETYAWEVLPESLRAESLADGIAGELTWLRDRTTRPPAT